MNLSQQPHYLNVNENKTFKIKNDSIIWTYKKVTISHK